MPIPFIKIKSLKTKGFKDEVVSVEAIKTRGLGQLQLTGLPDAWLRDVKEKIRCLISNLVSWGSLDRVLIHLLPAGIEKHGAHLELPIAVAALAVLDERFAEKLMPFLENYYFAGALTLTGEIVSTPESLVWQKMKTLKTVGAPEYSNLQTLYSDILNENFPSKPKESSKEYKIENEELWHPQNHREECAWLWLSYLAQTPVLLMGPPGIGKSYLAKWCEQLNHFQSSENEESTQRIYSMAELPIPQRPQSIYPLPRAHLSEFLGVQRQGSLRPGYFALAHNGTLVLDEFCEFSRDTREILRNILDEKQFFQNTRSGQVLWPAKFFLILTSNPCPCGKSLPNSNSECRCSASALNAYQARISGPLFDRMGAKLFLSHQQKRHRPLNGSIQIPKTKSEIMETFQACSAIDDNLEEESYQILSKVPFMESASKREIKYKAKLFCILKFLGSEKDRAYLEIIQEQHQNEKFLKQFHTRGQLPCSPFGNA